MLRALNTMGGSINDKAHLRMLTEVGYPFIMGMGRKNFLFANTPGGAQTGAVIYSLIEIAKETGLDPHRHLTRLITTTTSLDLHDVGQTHKLLPQHAPDDCRTRGS